MSDKGSDDEDYFGNHNDSDGKSPVGRAGRDGDDDEGDPEIPPRIRNTCSHILKVG